MNDIYIRTNILPSWLDKKYFNGTDLAKLEDLIEIIEDLDSQVDILQEELDDLKEDIRDNYKFIGQREAVGYNENW